MNSMYDVLGFVAGFELGYAMPKVIQWFGKKVSLISDNVLVIKCVRVALGALSGYLISEIGTRIGLGSHHLYPIMIGANIGSVREGFYMMESINISRYYDRSIRCLGVIAAIDFNFVLDRRSGPGGAFLVTAFFVYGYNLYRKSIELPQKSYSCIFAALSEDE